MKCPKCGGEIPFYDLRPNCKHCGVNIFYYSQDALLAEDAKRTELEAAVARMVIARIKATFIGGGLQIARLVFVLITAAALLLPIGSLKITVPFYEGGFGAGLLGVIQEITGMFLKIPQLLSGTLVAPQTNAAVVCAAFFLILVVIAVVLLVFYILSFTNPDKHTKVMRNLSVAGMAVALVGQAAALVLNLVVADTPVAQFVPGFGGATAAALFLVLFFLNRALLKKGIMPVYREYDPRRKELLKQVRAGEVKLADLTLPVFESEEEHAERLRVLEEALKAEGEE